MSGASNDRGTMRSSERVDELSEDIDVAIREFLERHPRTNPEQIRRAMRVVGRDACGADRRTRRAFALAMAFLLGVGLGAVLL
jgi:hypothetical protein